MNCREYRTGLIELARGGDEPAARRHASGCADCAAFLERQIALTELEHSIRDDGAAPAYVEPYLMREFVAARSRRRSRRPVWIAAAALAASIAVAWIVQLRPETKAAPVAARQTAPATAPVIAARERPRPKTIVSGRPPRQPAAPPREDDAPFVPIPYTQPLAPWERVEIVRMDMPVAALIAAGLPVPVSDVSAEARADVVVGEDGRARAVRLISISERSIER